MAAYDLEEQEQLDELKAWWNKYGNLITWGLVALAVLVVGWYSWNGYQRSRGERASEVYASLAQAVNAKDAQKARQLSGELLGTFDGTLQADLAALMAARAELDAGDNKGARSKLEWVMKNASEPALRDLARLRVASLQLDEKAHDAALQTLSAEPAPALAARFADLRGDVHYAKGAMGDARAAYKKAIELLGAEEGMAQFKAFVELKLEALGEA